jgi:hypothetical protein
MKKWRLVGLAFGLAAALTLSQFFPTGNSPARADDPKGKGEAALVHREGGRRSAVLCLLGMLTSGGTCVLFPSGPQTGA